MGYLAKISEDSLISALNQCDLHERPTEFLRTLYQQKYFYVGLKGTEMGQDERRFSDY